MPSPSRDGYAKLSLEEDLIDDESDDEAAKIRNFKNCPGEKRGWPEMNSGFFNRLVFGWYSPLIKLGGRVPLELTDIWQLDPSDAAPPNSNKFWELWLEEIERAERKSKRTGTEVTPWLGRPIVRLTWRQLAKGAILRFSCDMLSFARPRKIVILSRFVAVRLANPKSITISVLMQQILLICEGSPAVVSRDNAWMLAVTMAVVSILQMFLNTHYDNVRDPVPFPPPPCARP